MPFVSYDVPMKFLILLTFFSTNIFAADYECISSVAKLKLHYEKELSTLTVTHLQSDEVYYDGRVKEVIDRDGISDLMFETQSYSFLQLQFKTKDLKNSPEKIYGFSRGVVGGGFIDQAIQCFKIPSMP
jgi:hypothetical protein